VDDNIYVKIPDGLEKTRNPCPDAPTITSQEHVVVVGGGSGGISAVQTLRSHGFSGKITLVSSEGYPPIDRTKLSKALLTDLSKLKLRDESFYSKQLIDLLYKKVEKVDPGSNKVVLDDKSEISYTKLILSTGGTPNKLPMEGFDSSNVYVLRMVAQAEDIVKATQGKPKVVIIGSSFIGMELAVALKDKDITVVGMETVPLERVLGVEVGKGLQSLHEENGVKFKMDAKISGAKTKNGKVTSVTLESGEEIAADVVIQAVGIKPQTTFLDNFKLEKDKSLAVNEYLQVKGYDNIYACGDIATYPLQYASGKESGDPTRIEHWDVAMNHGQVAALNAMGKKQKFTKVPIFWSAQAGGAQLRYCGHHSPGDDVLVKGDVKGKAFVAYYCNGDNVKAVASVGKDPLVMKAVALFAAGAFPSRSEIEAGTDIMKMDIPT